MHDLFAAHSLRVRCTTRRHQASGTPCSRRSLVSSPRSARGGGSAKGGVKDAWGSQGTPHLATVELQDPSGLETSRPHNILSNWAASGALYHALYASNNVASPCCHWEEESTHHIVQEVAVVGDRHDGAGERGEELLQPGDLSMGRRG